MKCPYGTRRQSLGTCLLVPGEKWRFLQKSDTPRGTCCSATSNRKASMALERLWCDLVTLRGRMRHLEEETYRDMRSIVRGSRVCAESTHRYMWVLRPKYQRPDPADESMNFGHKRLAIRFRVGTRLTRSSRKSPGLDSYLLTSPECS